MYDLNKHYTKEYFSGHQFYKDTYKEIAAYLYDYLKPDSVIDVGCGAGYMLEYFAHLIPAQGIDGSPAVLEVSEVPSLITIMDFRLPQQISSNYDLVLSIEVAEHIEEQYADNFVDLLTGLGKRVLMTAAPVGQGGTMHVNCMPYEYWIVKMDKRGFTYNQLKTELIKSEVQRIVTNSKCNINYLPRNFMYFEKVI